MSLSQPKYLLGLLGRKLGHSFSAGYFTDKFEDEKPGDFAYRNFEIDSISSFPNLWNDHPSLIGLNVTIPYKEDVIPFLDRIDPIATRVGAVNTIIKAGGLLFGYNTDVIGFHASLKNLLGPNLISGALILGTGGAAKAVSFVLETMQIEFRMVSRRPSRNLIGYEQIDQEILRQYPLIIHTTPLGMYPKTDECPPIPYEFLGPHNYLFDLIYNPEKSLFLRRGEEHGCPIINGYEMLVLQAEASWKIWKQYLNFFHDRT